MISFDPDDNMFVVSWTPTRYKGQTTPARLRVCKRCFFQLYSTYVLSLHMLIVAYVMCFTDEDLIQSETHDDDGYTTVTWYDSKCSLDQCNGCKGLVWLYCGSDPIAKQFVLANASAKWVNDAKEQVRCVAQIYAIHIINLCFVLRLCMLLGYSHPSLFLCTGHPPLARLMTRGRAPDSRGRASRGEEE